MSTGHEDKKLSKNLNCELLKVTEFCEITLHDLENKACQKSKRWTNTDVKLLNIYSSRKMSIDLKKSQNFIFVKKSNQFVLNI